MKKIISLSVFTIIFSLIASGQDDKSYLDLSYTEIDSLMMKALPL